MSNYEYIFHMNGLSKAYAGGKKVLDDINLQFLPNAKIGVLGVNGSGKSTLLRLMAGVDTEFTGECWAAKGAKVGYLPQEPALNDAHNVRDNVMIGIKDKLSLIEKYNEISMKLAEDYSEATITEMTNLQNTIEAQGLWDIDSRVTMAMNALRCPTDDSDVSNLSGGERRRVALCQLLLSEPNLLLLDEPTNHLDAETVSWLERHLREFKGAVVMVTHDRYFLDNVTDWILELHCGRGFPYKGNYSSWLEQKQQRLEKKGKEEVAIQKSLARERAWIESSPKARQTKSKARISRYGELFAKANRSDHTSSNIFIPVSQPLGKEVLSCESLYKGYDGRLLIENLTFKLPPGGIVGVIGPNGVGKTTLFRMIVGQETQDSGKITVGESVNFGYVDQSRDALDPGKTVWEAISDNHDILVLGKSEINSRAYCSSFNFKGTDQQKKVSLLSGGERNRVHLARVLRSGSNVLLLDEPTNDLDVDTLRSLEDALEDFPGCVVVISHDRWFLDRVATHILAFEGNSHVEWFEGNFQDYELDKRHRLGQNAMEPRRIKYKPLTR